MMLYLHLIISQGRHGDTNEDGVKSAKVVGEPLTMWCPYQVSEN
jgi:hypothetical protein